MQQLIICKGLPGSGKSTWAKAWVSEDPKRRVRINRDDIRRMLGPYWMPTREDLVTDIERSSIISALIAGYSVVVDATNFKSSFLRVIGIKEGAEVVEKDFTHVPIETCIAQDLQRPKQEQVGEAVIKMMYNRYLKHNDNLRPANT